MSWRGISGSVMMAYIYILAVLFSYSHLLLVYCLRSWHPCWAVPEDQERKLLSVASWSLSSSRELTLQNPLSRDETTPNCRYYIKLPCLTWSLSRSFAIVFLLSSVTRTSAGLALLPSKTTACMPPFNLSLWLVFLFSLECCWLYSLILLIYLH